MEAWLSGCPPEGGRISKIYPKAPVLSSGGACLPAGRGIPSEGGQAPLAEKPEII